MKTFRKIFTCYTIVAVLAIVLAGCGKQAGTDKIVVLTFDDAVKSHRTFVAPLLKEKEFGATFFITHCWMEDTLNFMNWNDVADIHQMGFEIGNHSWTHVPLHTPEAIAGMEENLAKLDSALLAQSIPKPVSFGYPGNHYSPGTVEKLRELGYRFARRGMQPEIPYGKIAHGPLFDPLKNHPLVIPTSADAYPEMFESFMNYLEETGYKVIALKDLDIYFDIGDVEDPALTYTYGTVNY